MSTSKGVERTNNDEVDFLLLDNFHLEDWISICDNSVLQKIAMSVTWITEAYNRYNRSVTPRRWSNDALKQSVSLHCTILDIYNYIVHFISIYYTI
jgi:hypothetical protein